MCVYIYIYICMYRERERYIYVPMSLYPSAWAALPFCRFAALVLLLSVSVSCFEPCCCCQNLVSKVLFKRTGRCS